MCLSSWSPHWAQVPLPTTRHRRPPYVLCPDSCGRTAIHFLACTLLQLPLGHCLSAIHLSTTSRPPLRLWLVSLLSSNRLITASDGGWPLMTEFSPSPADNRRPAAIYLLGRTDGCSAVPSVLARSQTALPSWAVRRDGWEHCRMEAATEVKHFLQFRFLSVHLSSLGISLLELIGDLSAMSAEVERLFSNSNISAHYRRPQSLGGVSYAVEYMMS